jgi:biotin transport system substrate-specific component
VLHVSSRLAARDLALVAVGAALIAVLGLPGAFQPPGLSVPITAQTLGVMLVGLVLGARRGALAVLVFLVLVAAGLPLLAGGRGGLGVFAGPSAGFLVGWVPGAWVCGVLADVHLSRLQVVRLVVAAVIGGIVVDYAVGVPVLAFRTHVSLLHALTASMVFLPGDLAKAVVAGVVAGGVERGYPLRASRARENEVLS